MPWLDYHKSELLPCRETASARLPCDCCFVWTLLRLHVCIYLFCTFHFFLEIILYMVTFCVMKRADSHSAVFWSSTWSLRLSEVFVCWQTGISLLIGSNITVSPEQLLCFNMHHVIYCEDLHGAPVGGGSESTVLLMWQNKVINHDKSSQQFVIDLPLSIKQRNAPSVYKVHRHSTVLVQWCNKSTKIPNHTIGLTDFVRVVVVSRTETVTGFCTRHLGQEGCKLYFCK